MFTKESMFKIIADNNFSESVFNLADGTIATVTPCFYGEGMPSMDDIEYYLVSVEDLPYLSDDKLEKVADKFNKILDLRNEHDAEKIKLRKYFASHEAEGWDDHSLQYYSDWHKDVFGFRPHGHVCGVYVSPF